MKVLSPPEGTSQGYRMRDGSMWIACNDSESGKPGIAYCFCAGNLVNPSGYALVATFEKIEDRDLVLDLHRRLVVAEP